ncbi:hypothetical protein PFICI_00374 [Pestalotiopsis fici W106-1]|uniref:Uncharacterized protein n=1 Tax=Pestalotiopsis fici (strain W106-1 / CGMCC3.15140) TaxID=1229662 RepID=W3XMM3_PESFW|nr:uncharacterized protein PFICI_00374 [Pestalotiopsis fici W106-1]ETS86546.1 hypothetical protein PFICI_00374 [Pestalotiopsis fici W106-1]
MAMIHVEDEDHVTRDDNGNLILRPGIRMLPIEYHEAYDDYNYEYHGYLEMFTTPIVQPGSEDPFPVPRRTGHFAARAPAHWQLMNPLQAPNNNPPANDASIPADNIESRPVDAESNLGGGDGSVAAEMAAKWHVELVTCSHHGSMSSYPILTLQGQYNSWQNKHSAGRAS